jgi:hypothetical protein
MLRRVPLRPKHFVLNARGRGGGWRLSLVRVTYQCAGESIIWSIGAVASQTQDAPVNRETGEMGSENATGRDHQGQRAASVHCAECKCSSGLYWQGWRAYRVDDPETDEPPAVAFFCQACAEREFGYGADSAL